MRRPQIEALRELLRAAASAGLPTQDAARELIDLLDPVVARGERIERMRAEGLPRRVICGQLGISIPQFQRARDAHRRAMRNS
jgi:hypothetical protein